MFPYVTQESGMGEKSKGKAKENVYEKREIGQAKFLEGELFLLVWKNK